MWFILGCILGIVWLILLCIVIILLIIKIINIIKHKTDTIRFKRLFDFLLKSIIPFFFVLFLIGGCSTMFANPKFYYCSIHHILDRKYHCEYTIYGIFISGDEGNGIKIYFKDTKI